MDLVQNQLPATPNQTPQKAKRGAFSGKGILGVIGLTLFFVLVMVGVLISQKQRLDKGPQAPSAPESRPDAAAVPSGPKCTLEFYAEPLPGSPSPSPSVSPVPISLVCEKKSYQDEVDNGKDQDGDGLPDYELNTEKTKFEPGDIVVFAITVQNSSPTPIPVSLTDVLGGSLPFTFMDSNCGAGSYDPTTQTLTCDDFLVGGRIVTKPIVFRIRIKADAIAGNATNVATVYGQTPDSTQCANNSECKTGYTCYKSCPTCTVLGECRLSAQCKVEIDIEKGTGGPSPSPTPSPTPSVSPTPSPTPSVSPSPSPVYSCNSACTTDEQCRQANAGYVCDQTTERCRLDTNRTDTSCQPAQNTYACNSTCTTTAQCQTVNSAYVCDTSSSTCRLSSNVTATNCLPTNYTPPPPAVGCNDTCATNADCTNSNHICFTTADGTNRCRLENYVNSETCSAPPSQTTTPTQPVAQPALPEELPQSGPADWARWLQIGVITLGVGALLLLLL